MLCAALTTLAAADAPGPERLDQKVLEGKQIETSIRGLPMLGTFKPADVMSLSIEGPAIQLHTTLPAGDGERQLALQGVGGVWSVMVQRARGENAGMRVPQQFQIKHLDMTRPHRVYTHAAVYFLPGHLMLTEDDELAAGSLTVQLIDERLILEQTGTGLQGKTSLFVRASDDADHVTVNLRLFAPDLKTLYREHAAEVDQYLRPVLRDLKQEAILAIDPALAWQVLGGDAKPDRALAARVDALVRQMDAESYRDRAAAADTVRELGGPAAIVLMHADRTSLSDEQRTRIADALSLYRTLSDPEAAKLGANPDFLVDCLEMPDVELRRLAMARLEKTLGRKIAFEPGGTEAARASAIENLRSDLHPSPATAPATLPADSRR